jgi:Arylsulfatase A and related enzymes
MNVLWIIGDDLGVELSCYGDRVVRTPNIDRLAEQGTRFTQFHTTAPVCSASRSAFNVGCIRLLPARRIIAAIARTAISCPPAHAC